MTEISIDQTKQNAEEIADRFACIARLVRKELQRERGLLTDSANHIFADMLEDALDAGNNLDVPLDFEEFFKKFMPLLAKAPKNTPLNRVTLTAVDGFHEGRWKKASPAHYAGVCLDALFYGNKPRVMPSTLAYALNTIYCEQVLAGGTIKPKGDDTTSYHLEHAEDDLDRSHALVERFKRLPTEQNRLQPVIAAQEQALHEIKRALGYLDDAAPVAAETAIRPSALASLPVQSGLLMKPRP